jgi:hypothetical protein
VQEIAPGLWHWSARHERIGVEVSSHYLLDERVVIDPILPAEGLDWFAERGAPEHALLTNRHHDRDVWRLHDAFGTSVYCPYSGLHELAGRGPLESYAPGDLLPGGVSAHQVGSLCPDESALHIASRRALACADGVVRWTGRGPLTFVPDWLMDDPPRTKAGLLEAYRRLLAVDFDILLLAHGEPLVGGGHAALEAFTQAGA